MNNDKDIRLQMIRNVLGSPCNIDYSNKSVEELIILLNLKDNDIKNLKEQLDKPKQNFCF